MMDVSMANHAKPYVAAAAMWSAKKRHRLRGGQVTTPVNHQIATVARPTGATWVRPRMIPSHGVIARPTAARIGYPYNTPRTSQATISQIQFVRRVGCIYHLTRERARNETDLVLFDSQRQRPCESVVRRNTQCRLVRFCRFGFVSELLIDLPEPCVRLRLPPRRLAWFRRILVEQR